MDYHHGASFPAWYDKTAGMEAFCFLYTAFQFDGNGVFCTLSFEERKAFKKEYDIFASISRHADDDILCGCLRIDPHGRWL